MSVAVSIGSILAFVTPGNVVVLLAEILKERRDYLVLADPAERLDGDGGVSEEEVEELFEKVGAHLIGFGVLLSLSEGVDLPCEWVNLWELDLGVFLA